MRTHDLTSRSLHRRRGPQDVRHYGQNQSTTDIRSPFGGLPYKQAGQLHKFQTGPLNQYLGFGPQAGSMRDDRMQEHLAGATGPLGTAIRDIRGMAGNIGPQATAAGQRVSDMGEAMFARLQDQIGGALANLPGLQAYSQKGAALSSEGADLAARNARQTFGPLANEDIYQTSARRMTDRLRPALGTSGMLGQGGGAAMESDAIRELTADMAAQQRGARGAALEQMQGGALASQQAAAQAQQLGQAGVPLAQAGMEAVNPLMQYLQAGYGMPMQALGQLVQLLGSGQAPGLGLLQATGPMATTESKGYNIL